MKKIIFLLISSAISLLSLAQNRACDGCIVKPRARVIIDNDFGGDPDGLFHLAQQLLSPSTVLKAIVCSHHYKEFYGNPGNVSFAHEKVDQLLKVMKMADIPVCLGSDSSFVDVNQMLPSDGARTIIAEAMREDQMPLYILCGAGLTNIAAAYLMEPRIADHIRAVVWIGGSEYPEFCRNQLQKQREYNLGIDLVAAQVVFNHSTLHLWQIPRDTYRQALYSLAELRIRIGSTGATGAYLISELEDQLHRASGRLGEAYVLGDSPLALLTSLQTAWEADAASCEYIHRPCPMIDDNGRYVDNSSGRIIRVFTKIDGRLILEDFVAKLNYNK